MMSVLRLFLALYVVVPSSGLSEKTNVFIHLVTLTWTLNLRTRSSASQDDTPKMVLKTPTSDTVKAKERHTCPSGTKA